MAFVIQRDENFQGNWETNEGAFRQMGYKVGAKVTLAEAGLQIGDTFPEDSNFRIVANPRRRGKSGNTNLGQDIVVVTARDWRAV